jgi:phosphoribosylformylglycinamidine cyclo-ligase
MGEPEGLDYASSGVDIDLEGKSVASLVSALGNSVRTSGTPGAPVDLPGGFGGLIEFGDNLLALATDGVGSKLQIASQLNAWHGVGIDCMAMNVNDLLCVGAEPIAFVDYIATPRPDPEVHAAIGKSLSEACRRARVTLAGGETASLPEIVTELDLSGTALGYLPKGAAITGENLVAGDVLIGLPSSGIHSNGFSLIRKVIEVSGADLDAPAPFDSDHPWREVERFTEGEITLGEVLLNPTRIYCDPIVDLITACRNDSGDNSDERAPCSADDLHAIAHITGGGLSNLLRLHDSLGWHISDPLPPQPEFAWAAAQGGINACEMHRTFNMGLGMVIAVSAESAEAVCEWLAGRLAGCAIIGEVRDHGHKVTHVHPDVVYERY